MVQNATKKKFIEIFAYDDRPGMFYLIDGVKVRVKVVPVYKMVKLAKHEFDYLSQTHPIIYEHANAFTTEYSSPDRIGSTGAVQKEIVQFFKVLG